VQQQELELTVSVPAGGLRRYSFFGLGYRHNEPVPDRRTGWPVGRGVPLPRGAVREVSALRLRDASGSAVPCQARPLAHWEDGSVMFAHLAWQCDVAHDSPARFTLALDGGGDAPEPEPKVTVQRDAHAVRMDNGPVRLELGCEGDVPTLSLCVDGRTVFEGRLELWTRDAAGGRYLGRLDGLESVRVVECGPLVGEIELSGEHRDAEGGVFLNYELRLRLDAGRRELLLRHTFLNLGDEPEGVEVGEIGMRLPPACGARGHVVCQVASGQHSFPRLVEFPEDFHIHVGPTGPRISDTSVLREDTSDYAPYLMPNRDLVEPYVGVRAEQWSAVSFVHEACENYPKRIALSEGRIEYHVWPEGSDLQELRQGMARTHRIRLALFEPDVPAVDLHRYFYQCESPATVTVPFEWYQQCRVFGMQHVLPWMPARYPLLEGTLLSTIERSWAPGMLNYGDDPDVGYSATYAATGITRETVWINNEHDFTSQAVIQFWRSGRPGAWKSARVAAEHQIDVDFVRKSADRWKVGGIPAHCHRHTTAAVYPSHTWTEGLLQYYVTSGDERALEVARSLGRNLCQYVEERMVGLETESRMMGWALIALTALIEVTHDERCLRAARAIRDDIQDVVDRTGTYDQEGMNYGLGTVLTGLGNLHRVTGDEAALKLMLRIMDWHIEHRRNAVGIVWGDQLRPYSLNLTLPAYAYAYWATGERKYLEEGLRLFSFTGPPGDTSHVRSAGKQYRTFMPFLKLAHEAGALDDMERRMR